jgi:hypothetical protein
MDEHSNVAAGDPDLDLAAAAVELRAAGWDVIVGRDGHELAARLDPAPAGGVCSLVVDRAGRWRFTVVRDVTAPASRWTQIGERVYRALRREQRIITVTGRLEAFAELAAVLNDLRALALEESMVQMSSSEGEMPWDKAQTVQKMLIDP